MKKALLIAPNFFGYYSDIKAELVRAGFDTDYIPDRPSESVAFKSLGRINYQLVEGRIEKHAAAILERVKDTRYDLVLFVGGMSICLSREQFQAIRRASSAKFALYLWDALENCQRVGAYTDLFDAVLSFEKGDCRKHGFYFSPLFYARDYLTVPTIPEGGFRYDACFVGSVHQVSKFRRVKKMVDALEAQGARVYTHYYMPSRSVAILRSLQHPEYRTVSLRFNALNRSQIIELYENTRTIIDSPQQGQSGLTMRTIETIGARRRLVTANKEVEDYDFYKSGNILAIDDGQGPDYSFISADPNPIEASVYESYSIESWLTRILEVTGIED